MLDTVRTPRHVPAGTGSPDLWWLGGRLTIKLTGADSDGRIGQFFIEDPHGTSAPLHVQTQEEEEFFVLEGRMRFVVGEQRIDAGPGDIVLLPRGIPHTYVVTSERAKALVTVAPAGFEQFFADLGVPVEQGVPRPQLPPPSPEAMGQALEPYGCRLVGPPLTVE
jgi:quercetin dioxygenase-like cupin family protein